MKTQIITFGLLLAALNFTACKNNEAPAPEAPIKTAAPTPIDSTMQAPVTAAKDSLKPAEKEGKGEDQIQIQEDH